jgi:YHS domain-containing protein
LKVDLVYQVFGLFNEVIMSRKGFAYLGCLACLFFMTTSAVAQAAHDHQNHSTSATDQTFLGKGDGVTTCAVTGEELADKSIHGEFFGRTVYFCCAGCLAKAQKSPELYVKATEAEQAKAAREGSEFLGKGDGIETCPVTGEPVNKTLKGEVNGRTFYVCCEGCIETVKKSPELYLRPEKKSTSHEDHGSAKP